jgi:uncharacterized oligopeptide transporter (OPT) family protein
LQHPFKKLKPVKSRVSEDDFKKCGKQEGMEGVGNPYFGAGFRVGLAIVYIILIATWFFPLFYMLRFAGKMKTALAGNDQQALNIAFQNLKICFRFIGIVTIIILAFYAIAIVFGIIGASMFS